MKLISQFIKLSTTLVLMLFFGVWNSYSQNQFKDQNTLLSSEECVADLISQMILKEIEGEKMPVVLEGFDKGARSEITLPKSQIILMKENQALGKPAIIKARYPRAFEGNAITNVLFEDFSLEGRRPVTFYESVDDLPDFKSYDMENRTYKKFKGKPLFPFGHALSYINFTYRNFVRLNGVNAGEQMPVLVEVTNVLALNGEEVV